jgi:NADPH:quinone reductase
MKAAWYEKQGAARDVLVVGEMEDPQPRAGEVRIRVAFSGVNPGDVKKRENAFGVGMPYPRVIPHSDGSGTVDAVGDGVSREWVGRRVWCYGAQSYRPFGTAAEYTVVPLKQAVELPKGVPLEQGACLGIPGITAHRAVHVGGSVEGKTVLVQGGSGAVGPVLYNSRIEQGRVSSRLAEPKATRKSHRGQEQTRFYSQMKS